MSSSAFQRFMQGEDELSALLRQALPAYEAPAGMEARFREQVQALQAGRAAAVTAMSFEAPASQSLAFARLAADVQSAQAPRRDAVLGQIRSGRPASEVLGAAISEQGLAWLQQQSRTAAPAQPAPAVRSPARRSMWMWGGGSAFASLLLMALGLRISGVWPNVDAMHKQYSGEVVAASAVTARVAGAELAQLDKQYQRDEQHQPAATPVERASPAAVPSAPMPIEPPARSSTGAMHDLARGGPAKDDGRGREYTAKSMPARVVAEKESFGDLASGSAGLSASPPVLNETSSASSEWAAASAEQKTLAPAAEMAVAPASRNAAKRAAPFAGVAAAPQAADSSADAALPAAGERLVLLRIRPAAAAAQLLADMPDLASVTLGMAVDDGAHQRWVADFRAALHRDKPEVGVLRRLMPGVAPDRILIVPHAAPVP